MCHSNSLVNSIRILAFAYLFSAFNDLKTTKEIQLSSESDHPPLCAACFFWLILINGQSELTTLNIAWLLLLLLSFIFVSPKCQFSARE